MKKVIIVWIICMIIGVLGGLNFYSGIKPAFGGETARRIVISEDAKILPMMERDIDVLKSVVEKKAEVLKDGVSWHGYMDKIIEGENEYHIQVRIFPYGFYGVTVSHQIRKERTVQIYIEDYSLNTQTGKYVHAIEAWQMNRDERGNIIEDTPLCPEHIWLKVVGKFREQL